MIRRIREEQERTVSAIAQKYNLMRTHPLTIARIARGWSQAYLAELLGVSTRTVARWELGQTLPYPIYREQLCRLLGLNLADLGLLSAQDVSYQTDRDEADATGAPLLAAPALRDPMIPETLEQVKRLQGRDVLLHQIKQSLLVGKSQSLTALQGLPGVGKTAMALAVATDAQVQAHFSAGILWAQMGPQADVLELLTRWGALLGLKETDIGSSSHWSNWGKILQASIGQRRMLLVIDDVWSVEAALALQVGGPQCVHLLTTRLPQIAFACAQETTIVVPELDEADGLALLERFVPQVVAQEAEVARALVQMVGGLPLALNLLGKHLAMQVLTGQPRRVRTALSHLFERRQRMAVSLPMPLPERPLGLALQPSLSLQATIALSVERLAQEEQADLAALALFPAKPNSFSEAAALAVSGGSVERLDALWDSGLLESSGPGRYTLHPTIVDYAREMGTDQAAWQRLSGWTADLVQKHRYDYVTLEQERATIEAYLEGSQANDYGKSERDQRAVVQIILGLIDFQRMRGLSAQEERWLLYSLQAAEALADWEAVMRMLLHLCEGMYVRGEYDRAEQYGQRGLRVAQQSGEAEVEKELQVHLRSLVQARQDYEQPNQRRKIYGHMVGGSRFQRVRASSISPTTSIRATDR